MQTWFGENWWWLIPVALLVPSAVLVTRRVKTALRGPNPVRAMAHGTTKWILGAFALLLGASALSNGQIAAFAPALLMVAILHVPVTSAWVPPNWVRYVAYVALLFVFAAVWDVDAVRG